MTHGMLIRAPVDFDRAINLERVGHPQGEDTAKKFCLAPVTQLFLVMKSVYCTEYFV